MSKRAVDDFVMRKIYCMVELGWRQIRSGFYV